MERTKPKAPEDLGVSEMQVAVKTNAKAEEGSQVATVAKVGAGPGGGGAVGWVGDSAQMAGAGLGPAP